VRPKAGCGIAAIAGGLLALAVGAAAAHDAAPVAPFPVALGGPFDLIDHEGRRRTERDFRGRYLLIYFGYAACNGMCPLNLARLADAVDLLGAAGARVQPVFVTVDPARDTPARLAAFVGKLHPRLIGLTGTAGETAAMAKAYGVTARPVAGAGDGGAVLAHGLFTYLVGPEGRLLTLLPPVMDAESMVETIRRYLH